MSLLSGVASVVDDGDEALEGLVGYYPSEKQLSSLHDGLP
jgi:hypothetical protein